MKVITLTLNPAFDIHCRAEVFEAEHENLARIISRDIGGKGINISRALKTAGINNTAVILLGNENKAEFLSQLSKTGINCYPITVNGRIRENITVHTEGRRETRLSFYGFKADASVLEQVEMFLLENLSENDIVTITGSLPAGIEISEVKALIGKLTLRKVKTVIDSRSFSLNDVLDCKPFLIKPNEEEISAYLGKSITDFSELSEEMKKLHFAGIENVLVSLGEKGLALCCNDGVFTAAVPEINAVSTIGAGDSSIAGFISAFSLSMSKKECLKTAAAFGTAACLTVGTNPPETFDIKRIKQQVIIKKEQ